MSEQPFLFGTAGWSYKDWEGPVYPEQKARDFNHLEFLSREKGFDFVEVNTSFYRIPSLKLTEGWVRKTQGLPDFRFWLKLFSKFTHERKVSSADVQAFKASLEPLRRAGKLSGLLIQFPYSFKLNTGHLKYTLALADIFAEYTLALEFRHNTWERREFFDILKEKNLIWTNIDQPEVSLSLPLTAVMTHEHTTYFRLHGRNEQAWFSNQGRDARYDYDYNMKELGQISRKIKELVELAKTVFISGNNHYKGSAVKNLIELKKELIIGN
jgi:uncharacterized protein YecE (DUF72 family)